MVTHVKPTEIESIIKAVDKLDPSKCIWLTPVNNGRGKPPKSKIKYFEVEAKTRKETYKVQFRRFTYTTGNVIDEILLSVSGEGYKFATAFKESRELKATLRKLFRDKFVPFADQKEAANSWLHNLQTETV